MITTAPDDTDCCSFCGAEDVPLEWDDSGDGWLVCRNGCPRPSERETRLSYLPVLEAVCDVCRTIVPATWVETFGGERVCGACVGERREEEERR